MSALSYVVPGQATRWLDVSVAAVRPVCRDVVAIELDYAVPLPPHDAGSHIKVELAIDGRRGVRSYSVVEHRQAGRLVVAVRRLDNGQGGSKAMHGLRAGDVLRATLPGNHFLLLPGAPSYLLIAGGIGITPMIGMARTLHRLRAPFQLLYLGRSRASMPFVDDLAEEFGADLRVHVDEDSGPIDLGPSLAALPAAAEAYLCGPGPMLAAVRELWRGLGRPSELLRFETFGSASEKAWAPFRVSVPQYDVAFEVPSDRSFLEMLEEAGCEPLYFCQRGECGLCAVDVLQADGDLDHRDVFFSETQRREGRQICVCVSRVTGSITIAMP